MILDNWVLIVYVNNYKLEKISNKNKINLE